MNDHPPLEVLRLWVAGRLGEEQSGAVESHVEACKDVCQPLLDRLSSVEGSVPPTASHDSSETFASPHVRPKHSSESPGSQIGPFKILQILGEGGFGTVFLAEQKSPIQRRVALKIIKLGMDTKEVIARFEAERQALAMMDHPNIAKVFDAGATNSGRPYFVMELVKGVPLTQYCDTHNLSTDERLELFRQVCLAVQHAHQKGIIHRDLKPSNVLISMHDGKPVPKVIDFGIAKATSGRLTDKTLHTELNAIIGTPEYMSPEQAEMTALDIDTRSDIYSLGVMLYEILTSTTPFNSKELRTQGHDDIRRIIREVEPPRPSVRLHTLGGAEAAKVSIHRRTDPRKLEEFLRGELDWIVMKALEKDRTRRYDTAQGLSLDVQRYLQDEPVQARPATVTYRVGKFVRKHKVGVVAVAVVALALVMGVIGTTVGMSRARSAERVATGLLDDVKQAQTKAEEEAQNERVARQKEAASAANERLAKNDAQAQAETARRELYIGNIGLANAMMKQGDYQRARDLLASCPTDLRHWEWRYLSRIALEETYPIRLSAPAVGLCFSPRSDILAIASSNELSIWDFNDLPPQRVAVQSCEQEITALAFDSAGDRMATAQKGGAVRLWDACTLKLIGSTTAPSPDVKSLAFLPDRKGFAFLSASGQVYVQREANGKLDIRALDAGDDLLVSMAVSADGRYVAAGCKSQKLRVWDLASGKVRVHVRLQNHEAQATGLAFLPGTQMITYTTAFDSIGVRDRDTGLSVWRTGLPGETKSGGLSAAADGSRIAGAYENGVALFDPQGGFRTRLLQDSDRDFGRSPGLSRNGRFAAAVFQQRFVRVWDLEHERRAELDAQTLSAIAVSVERSSGRMAYLGWGHYPVIVDPDGTHRHIAASRPTPRHAPYEQVCSLAWTTDGAWLAFPVNGGVAVADPGTGSTVIEFDTPTNLIAKALTFADRGQVLVVGFWDGTVGAWDLQSRKELWRTTDSGGRLTSLVALPDNDRQILVGRWSDKLTVRGIRDGRVQRSPSTNGLRDAASFSPDGHTLYGKDDRGWLLALDWPSCRVKWRRFNPSANSYYYADVAISADGRRVAEVHQDRTVHLWDTANGQELLTLSGAPSQVMGLAWSADGADLIAANQGANRSGLVTWHGPPPAALPAGGIDLLAACRTSDGVKGDWKAQGPSLVGLAAKHFVLEAPIRLRGGYHVELEVVRRSPTGSFGVTLPLEGRQCDIEVAGFPKQGYLTGLDVIDGLRLDKRIGRTDTCTQGLRIETGKTVRLAADVRLDAGIATIRAEVDGRQVVDWSGPVTSLSVSDSFKTPAAHALGLCGYGGEVEFRRFAIKPEGDEYELLSTPDPAGPRRSLVGPGAIIDLLPLARPDLSIDARWTGSNDGGPRVLATAGPCGRVVFPVNCRGSYELTAVFRRTGGHDIVGFLLPVSGRQIGAYFSGWPHGTGLSHLNDLSVNDERHPGPKLQGVIHTGDTYTVVLRAEPHGDQARLSARMDGRELFSYDGPAPALSLNSNWKMDHRDWLGIGSHVGGNTFVFDRLDLKILDGDATIYPPAPAGTTQPATEPAEAMPSKASLKQMPHLLPGSTPAGLVSPEGDEGGLSASGLPHKLGDQISVSGRSAQRIYSSGGLSCDDSSQSRPVNG